MDWSVEFKGRLGALALEVEMAGADAPVALVGPNGSGKTTVLRVIAGAYRPGQGRVRIGDRTLYEDPGGIHVLPESRRVGYVPQGYGLFPHLTVLDNVAFGLRHRHRKSSRHDAAGRLLERMGCGHLAGRRFPSALSGGEQQKIALARALMVDPDLLLLDEPLSALDASARRRLRTYLGHHLADRGKPAIVVTHDVRDVVGLGIERVVVVERGRVTQKGAPGEIAARPASDFVAEFFGTPFDQHGLADSARQPLTE